MKKEDKKIKKNIDEYKNGKAQPKGFTY